MSHLSGLRVYQDLAIISVVAEDTLGETEDSGEFCLTWRCGSTP